MSAISSVAFIHHLAALAESLPSLAVFAIAMVIIVGVPRLCRRVRLPAVVGLLLSGVVIGPHGLAIVSQHHPVADFIADLGKLFLMFIAGLEIDLVRFRQARQKTMVFGLVTTSVPLVLGTAVDSCSAMERLRRSCWDRSLRRIRFSALQSSRGLARYASNRSRSPTARR